MLFPRALSALLASTLISLAGFVGAGPAAAQTIPEEVDHSALVDRALAVLSSQFGRFRVSASGLAASADGFCAGVVPHNAHLEALRDTWLAWAPLDAYQFGPIEQRAAVLTIAFWPDKKDYVGRGLDALLTLPAETLMDPDIIAQGSAAAQGLPAIERLMHSDKTACPAVVGISRRIDGLGQQLYHDWFSPGGWAELMGAAGPDNPVYRSEAEVTKALFTAITFQLTVMADSRLGRPLGTFNAPRPTRAEAWRSGLSFDVIDAQLVGIADMLSLGFGGALAEQDRIAVLDAIDDTRARIDKVGATLDAAVADPMTRIRVEGLQTQVGYLQTLVTEDIGRVLAVESGFSPADGD